MSDDVWRMILIVGTPILILLGFTTLFWSLRGFHEKIYGPDFMSNIKNDEG